MHSDDRHLGRRGFLGLLAVTSIAGCAGGGSADDATPSPTPGTATATADPMPTETGDESGGTSLAGSCASAFGDTDERYDPGSLDIPVTFAYPMAGEVTFAGSDGDEAVIIVGYGGQTESEYAQELTVTVGGPLDSPFDGSELAQEDGWSEGGTVSYDGREQTIAVQSTDSSETWAFGFTAEDGDYGFLAETAAVAGEPCPDAYANVCERVVSSVEPGA